MVAIRLLVCPHCGPDVDLVVPLRVERCQGECDCGALLDFEPDTDVVEEHKWRKPPVGFDEMGGE